MLAEFASYGITEDAYDATAPDPSGEGAANAMQLALDESGLSSADFSWIVAHGTGTQLNDSMESAAIKRIFGEMAYSIPVTSIKSMIGHAMGAAGAQSAAVLVKAMQEETIVPTINYTTPDPECDLDYVTGGADTVDPRRAVQRIRHGRAERIFDPQTLHTISQITVHEDKGRS
ncbi:MAG: hypothetical protein R2856_12680 [Caldilineaceae bacterium]